MQRKRSDLSAPSLQTPAPVLRPPWRARVKASMAAGLRVAVELGLGIASLSGAVVTAATGKLAATAILITLALGVFLRFAARRSTQARQALARPPAWIGCVAALAAVLEVAFLVEATGLPVRHDQPGFEPWNWGWVLAAVAALYWLQRHWLLQRWLGAQGQPAADSSSPRS